MENQEFFNWLKIGEEIPSLEKEAFLEGYRTPEIFGGIELAVYSAKAKEMAEVLGIDTIHTSSKVFDRFLCFNSFRK